MMLLIGASAIENAPAQH